MWSCRRWHSIVATYHRKHDQAAEFLELACRVTLRLSNVVQPVFASSRTSSLPRASVRRHSRGNNLVRPHQTLSYGFNVGTNRLGGRGRELVSATCSFATRNC